MEDKKSVFLDISAVLSGEKRELCFEYDFPFAYEYGDINVLSPGNIMGRVTGQSGYVTLEAQFTVTYETFCVRCLTPLVRREPISIHMPVAETLQQTDNEEYLRPDNGRIELTELCRVHFIINLPYCHLCGEDCKGLCEKCGEPFHGGFCGCGKNVPPEERGKEAAE